MLNWLKVIILSELYKSDIIEKVNVDNIDFLFANY